MNANDRIDHHYEPELLGHEGIFAAVLVFLAPFVLLCFLSKILPPIRPSSWS